MRVSGIATTYVRAGTYALSSPLQLSAADSNHAFLGYPGETAVLSGGERITDFRDEGGGMFSALVAGGPVGLDLSIGGVRQRAAQSGVRDPTDPTSGFFWADEAASGPSKRAFTFRDGDIQPGSVQAGTKVQVFDRERLTDDIVTVQSVDFATHTISLTSDTWYPLRNGSTFRLLNDAAFIRNAGEFGWRAADSRLVVKPQDPAGFEQAGVVTARRGTLIEVTGATGITLQGLTFADTTWDGTAVRLTNAVGNRIGNNHFLNVGTALSLTASSQNLIGGNQFEHLGANGIVLNAGSNGNGIYANRLEHIGDVAKYVAAISGSGINDNVFSYNGIAYSARDGIAIKNWSVDTKNVGNVVEYNRIAHTGLETADAAAISVLGRSDIDTRMTIRGNWIEDANGVATAADHTWLRDYKGFGVYLDDQANGVSVTDNFIDNADWAGVFIHGGDNNTVQNNLAVMHGNHQELIRIEWVPLAGDAGTPRNNTVVRNIAYGTQAVDDYWELLSANTPMVDGNLVFNSTARGPGDVTADPGFLDPAHGDWRLGAGSPAGALGIHELPWAQMGLAGYVASGNIPAFWNAAAAPPSTPVSTTTTNTSGGGFTSGGGGASVSGVGGSGGGSSGVSSSGITALPILQAIAGSPGDDRLVGSSANDRITSGAGHDAVLAGDGNDVVYGNLGNDVVYGNLGSDTLFGGQDADLVFGGKDADAVYGNLADDMLFGNQSDDTLYGGQGNDTLSGGQGNDVVRGNLGDDVLWGNLGDDTLAGGAGADTFVMQTGGGADVVADIIWAEGDRIGLHRGMTWSVAEGAGGAVVSFGNSDQVTLVNVRASAVNGSWFVSV